MHDPVAFSSARLPTAHFDERLSQENLVFWVPLLIECTQIEAGHRVLDVGCGTGGLARAIAETASAAVTGSTTRSASSRLGARCQGRCGVRLIGGSEAGKHCPSPTAPSTGSCCLSYCTNSSIPRSRSRKHAARLPVVGAR